jgi:hypothetical protein
MLLSLNRRSLTLSELERVKRKYGGYVFPDAASSHQSNDFVKPLCKRALKTLFSQPFTLSTTVGFV